MLARISRLTLPILIIVVALAAYRLVVIGREPPAIELAHNRPVTIGPRFNDERVVTDEQLALVLDRVKPPPSPVNTNNFVHALRLWGAAADFDEASIPTGQQLRDYFLNDATFRQLAGEKAPPLFFRGRDGIEVRSFDDRVTERSTSSYHTDDLIATLAEVGTPLDTPLVFREGEARVEDLLATSLRSFHLDRHEFEWTAIAYARYVFPQPHWRNKYGERIDIDRLVEELVRHAPDRGPCNGLHRLEALVVLNRADEQFRVVRPRTKLKMLVYLKRASQQLVAAQTADGYWTRQWPQGAAAHTDASQKRPMATTEIGPTLHDKLLVTGHHLEWLALAPEEVQPPRETIIRAAQWLARALIEMDQKELLEAYGPYTHAARALCLWRGVEPFEAWRNAHVVEQAPPFAQVRR